MARTAARKITTLELLVLATAALAAAQDAAAEALAAFLAEPAPAGGILGLITAAPSAASLAYAAADEAVNAAQTEVDRLRALVAEEAKCRRCNGSGRLPEYHYHMNGMCFSCGGTGER